MIYQSLNCLAEEINEFFRVKLKINEDKVVLSSIVNQDGTVAIPGENRISLTLINIEKESAKTSGGLSISSKSYTNTVSSLSINLQILFSVYFSGSNYPEGLKFLSFILSFLNSKNVFNHSNTPRLPDEIEKLSFEFEPVGLERLNNIWAMMGAKYMPSLLYKVRMLTFDDSTITEYRPAIQGMSQKNGAVTS